MQCGCGTVAFLLILPFAGLVFALCMVFLSVWCLFCCCCPFCPEFLQNLPSQIFSRIFSDRDRKFIKGGSQFIFSILGGLRQGHLKVLTEHSHTDFVKSKPFGIW